MTVAVPSATTDHYTIISADCHGGGSTAQYREYLEAKYHDGVRRVARRVQEPVPRPAGRQPHPQLGRRAPLGRPRSRRSGRRGAVPEHDPAVLPDRRRDRASADERRVRTAVGRHPGAQPLARRLLRARARPARRHRADLSSTTSTTRCARSTGRRNTACAAACSIPNIPPDQSDLPPIYDPSYDPIWATCQELDMPVNSHSGTGFPDHGKYPFAQVLWVIETPYFAHRPLWFMIMGGIFERFPRLKFVMTESGAGWVPETIRQLDGLHMAMTMGRTGEVGFDPSTALPMKPSEYFARNCWIGASFPSPNDGKARTQIGLDKYMWGSDYPHHEGATPFSRESIRRAFARRRPRRAAPDLRGQRGRACTASTSTSSRRSPRCTARPSRRSTSRTKACPEGATQPLLLPTLTRPARRVTTPRRVTTALRVTTARRRRR